MNDYVNLSYYFADNGQKDAVVNILSDCIDQCAYLIMKNKYKITDDSFELMINELTFYVSRNKSNIDIKVVYNLPLFFNIAYSPLKQTDAYYEIIRELNEDNMVILFPVKEILPFSVFYKEDFQIPGNYWPFHTILIISQDDDNFYFVENPDIVAKHKALFYENNKQVGMISKSLIKKMSEYFCSYATLTLNETYLKEYNFVNDAFNLSISNFYKENVVEEGTTYYYGINAIKELISMCNEEFISLRSIAPTDDRDILAYLDWMIWCIKNRRKYMYCYLLTQDRSDNLKEALQDSIKRWETLYRIMCKNYGKKQYLLDKSYVKYFKLIMDAEENILIHLKQYKQEKLNI